MRSLLKRFTAVATAVIILFSLVVAPVSAAETNISIDIAPGFDYSNWVNVSDPFQLEFFNEIFIKKIHVDYPEALPLFCSFSNNEYQFYFFFPSVPSTITYSGSSMFKFTYLSDHKVDYVIYRPSFNSFTYNSVSYRNLSFKNTTSATYYNFDFLNFSFENLTAPDPVEKKHLYGVAVGELENKKGFIEWLKSEGKISLINSSGYSFAEKQIDLLVDCFESYGGSPLLFMGSLIKTFNITTNFKAASSLVQTLQQLYSDYMKYKRSLTLVEINPSSSVHPHWRTNKEDTSLVTDQADDTSDISLLREILRTLIVMPQNIAANLSYVQQGFTDLLFNFQRLIALLDSLPDDTHNSFNSDLDALINAINNSSGGSGDITVDVNITDERQKEIDDFFSDWNLQYSDKISEKIPVLNQLSELFNEEFFEKCGIDVNEDGEVYEYYRPELSMLSAEAVPDKNQQLISDFLNNFDDADSDFLNNVSFTSDVPDFSISINGQKHSIFNFNLYAKYRAAIHSIIIFVSYTLYFLSLYKSLPGIIGNVSDVAHVFSDRG